MLQRLAALSFISFFAACGTSTGGPVDAGSDPDLICDASPPATSFAKVYTDIFQPACTASCHKAGVADGSDSYGLYDTEAKAYESVNKVSLYAGSEKTLKIVDPGKLDNSTMFMKCLAKAKSPAGKNLGGAMPLSAAALTATQKKLLKDWICSGAKM